MRIAYTAGEAIGPDLFSFFRSIGLNLKQLYGQTEAFLYLTAQPDGQIFSDTVGPVMPNVQLRIADNGEVLFKSPGMFVGYFKDDAKTAEVTTPDGFIKTGDAGFFDPRTGHLRIIDRAKDVGRLNDGTLIAPKYIENKLKFYPNIREAVVYGDQRDFVCVMLNIDLTAVGNWAERNNIVYGSYQELAGHPQVYDLLAQHVAAVNRSLVEEKAMAGAQIRRFLILHKELDADDGEVTRTQKVRRSFVAERYAPLIRAFYDGSSEADISTEVTFEDGRKGVLSARVKIRDAEVVPRRAGPGEGAHESAAPQTAAGEHAAVGRGRVAVVRRREGGERRLVRHPQGRNPRDHRPERRRQDVDAQRHQRLLPSAGRPHHLQGPGAPAHAPVRRGARRHRAHVPERGAVQGHDGARQHHDRPHAQDAARAVLAAHPRSGRRCAKRSSTATGSKRSSTS